MFSLCSDSSSWIEPYHTLEVTEEIFSASISCNKSADIDIFDNPFIPTYPIAYFSSDFYTSTWDGGSTASMDPSVWRVLPEEEPMFVRPKDLIAPLETTRSASPSISNYCPPLYRPTLDEFMSTMDHYRDSPENTTITRINGLTIRPKSLETTDRKPTNAGKRSYACPFPHCSHVCSNRNDLERHLSCREHKEPSIPCPKRCGALFTRKDSAKRHGKSCRSRAT